MISLHVEKRCSSPLTVISFKYLRTTILYDGSKLEVPLRTAQATLTVTKEMLRVAKIRENIWKIKIFQVRKKSENFVDGQGNLERTWKVREKSGNLKINGCGRQISENLLILFKRGKDVLSHEIVHRTVIWLVGCIVVLRPR